MVESMFRNGHGKPVVALDIDGTLGDYHGHFLKFAEGYFGLEMPDPSAINRGLQLWEHMGVSQKDYRDCKLAYRQGGLKRTMPVYEGSEHLVWGLKAEGVEVWICTTRPYLRLDNIDPDTREWLSRNGLMRSEKDLRVVFGEDKYLELIRQVGLGRIVAIADDLTALTAQALGAGIPKAYLRDQPYNRVPSDKKRVGLRYADNQHLWGLLAADLEAWKAENE